MPKIVNKEEKRKEIALACSDLIHEVGIKKLTVSQVAKTAGIGKGTVYEYFENKEDIIFEIINHHIEEHQKEFLESVKNIETTREKVIYFFKFVTDDSEENQKHFNGYKEYLSIVLSEENDSMLNFNTTCNSFFTNQLGLVLQEGIDKGQLKENSMDFVETIMTFEKGVVLLKLTQREYDAKRAIETFVHNLFNLIERKEESK